MGGNGMGGFSRVAPYISRPFPNEVEMTVPTWTQFPIWRSGNGGTAIRGDRADGQGVRITGYIPAGNSNSLTYLGIPCVIGAGGWQVTARLRRSIGLISWGGTGLGMKSGAKNVVFEWGANTAAGIQRQTYSGDDTYVGSAAVTTWYPHDFWLRIRDNMTSWIVYISSDGDFWQQIYLEARNGYLGANPDYVSVYTNPNFNGGAGATVRTGTPVATDIFSWKYEVL